jgi:hypothetical protein
MQERLSETVWTDPATMADDQIETELAEVAVKLAELHASGCKIGELEARQWRLRAEQTFRQRNRANEISQSERGELISGEEGE